MLNSDVWINRLVGGLVDTGLRVLPESIGRIMRLIVHYAWGYSGAPQTSTELSDGGCFESLISPVVMAHCLSMSRPSTVAGASIKTSTGFLSYYLRRTFDIQKQ
jgi:type IV secretion system protein VirB11